MKNPFPKLELDKNRHRVKECPCGKSNKDGKFVPYKGFEDKGYCHACGENFMPELPGNIDQAPYLFKNKNRTTGNIYPHSVDFISPKAFKDILVAGALLYEQNHFIQWLGAKNRGQFAFDADLIQSLVENYFLGNSTLPKYKGWVLFPYIDINGRVCDIKAMDYDPQTGKRVQVPYSKVVFIGKDILQNPNANTVRCFFGEHRLKGNNKPIRIFESEATAIYATPFFPDSICLATGGISGCKWTERDKCIVLKGRTVILYPDIDAHGKWEENAETLRSYGVEVKVSQLIKSNALKFAEKHEIDFSELVKLKYDLRDILKEKDVRVFINPETTPLVNKANSQHIQSLGAKLPYIKYCPKYTEIDPILNEVEQVNNWNEEILKLEEYFNKIRITYFQLKLDQSSNIINIEKFIASHLETVRRNNGNKTFLPYLNRLQQLKLILSLNLTI